VSDADARAVEAVQSMLRKERALRWLGMRLEEVRAGYARLSMDVTESMMNGHDVCHGGMIFSLADTALGFACNSRGSDALVTGASIEFLAPARLGDVLTAECVEQARAGRSGFYDMRVTRQDGELIALLRGRSATIRGKPA
jgi:acyl-CoA thioesterase